MKRSVQDVFLKILTESRSQADVYLKNGIKLKGKIVGYDGKTLLLESDNPSPQLVLIEAISTVVPLLEPKV